MTTTIDASTNLGDLVTAHPELAAELERLGLDYCGDGVRPLTQVCADRGIDPKRLLDRLAGAALDAPPPDWATMDAVALVDHIEATHHRWLRDRLRWLGEELPAIVAAHGRDHPELFDALSCFEAFRRETEPHLAHEEQVLFPNVRQLLRDGTLPAFHCGTLNGRMSVLRREHAHHDELLGLLRSVTLGFRAPIDAEPRWVACYDALRELEADTRLHLHKENNVLFRAIATAEEAVRARRH